MMIAAKTRIRQQQAMAQQSRRLRRDRVGSGEEEIGTTTELELVGIRSAGPGRGGAV